APIGPILAALRDAAPLLWPSVDDALARVGAAEARRVPANSSLAAATMWSRIARAVDAPATALYQTEAAGSPDVPVVCASPPIVVLGQRLVEGARSALETRFLLARAAELARPARIIATGLPADEVDALISA